MKRRNAFLENIVQQKKELEEIKDTQSKAMPQEEKVVIKQKIEAKQVIPVTEKPVVIVKKEVKKITKPSKQVSHLKQVNLTIGEEREFKLDDLAYEYARKKKFRVNRNDVVRYLIDNATIEELLDVDLSKHEK